MKASVHLWWYLAHFFLEWEIFPIKHVEKIHMHFWCSINIFRKSRHLWANVEKYDRARQATDDIRRRKRIACWITRDIDTHTLRICNIILFHCNIGWMNASQCYVAFLSHFDCVEHDVSCTQCSTTQEKWMIIGV